jgi:hypothetical protein
MMMEHENPAHGESVAGPLRIVNAAKAAKRLLFTEFHGGYVWQAHNVQVACRETPVSRRIAIGETGILKSPEKIT